MLRFNEEMHKAGVLLAAEGLLPRATGARVVYAEGRRTVLDGPFAEAKELVAGFYLIDVSAGLNRNGTERSLLLDRAATSAPGSVPG
jgi:hypothetical protein